MAGADKLYTPELLALAVGLAEFPADPSLPLHGEARSKSCGSTLSADIGLDEAGHIERIGLQVRACAVGQAAAAIFAKAAVGRNLAEIESTHAALLAWLAGTGALARLAGPRRNRAGARLSRPPRRDHAAVDGGARRPFHCRPRRLIEGGEGSERNTMASAAPTVRHIEPSAADIRLVIAASSAGTIFEWYDFFIYGTLAALIGKAFVPSDNELARTLTVWAGFAVGFGFRPLGAVLFGYLGDKLGRKYTFLVTVTLMGIATAGVGLVPSVHTLGLAAPAIVIMLRIMQGLALGGEYGGAAIFVSEHCPPNRRGFYTGFIQASVVGGFVLSLIVVLACKLAMSAETWNAWGWRVPFVLSLALLAISLWMRLKLSESPVFQAMRAEGRMAKNPFKESFTYPGNRKRLFVALFGVAAGLTVIWYTAMFRGLSFLTGPDAGGRDGRRGHRRHFRRVRHVLLRVLRLAVGQGRPQGADRLGLCANAAPAVPVLLGDWLGNGAIAGDLGPRREDYSWRHADHRHHGRAAHALGDCRARLTARSPRCWPRCFRRRSATARCRSPTTSAPGTSAGSCR